MNLKNRYKDSMDKIIVDEEMKKRILSNIDKIEKPKNGNKSIKFIRIAGMYAACFALILGGINIKSFISKSNLNEDKYVVVEDDTIGIQNEECVNNSDISEVPNENAQDDNEGFTNNTYRSYSSQNESPRQNKVIAYKDTIDKNQNSNYNIKEQRSINEGEISRIEGDLDTSLSENSIIDEKIQDNNKDIQNDDSDMLIENTHKERSMSSEIGEPNFEFKISKVLEENYEKNINFISDELIDIVYTKANNTIEYKVYKGEVELNSMDNYKEIEINNTDFKFNMNQEDTVKSVTWHDDNVSYSMEAYENISKEEAVNIVKSLDTFN